MKKSVEKNPSLNSAKLVVLFFLAVIISIVGSKFIIGKLEQDFLNKQVIKAKYPELVGKKPTFRFDIKTSKSTTHVISYLSSEVINEENFDKKAAKEAIEYVESVAGEKLDLIFNPFLVNGIDVSIKFVPRGVTKNENFVFITSIYESLPQLILKESKNNMLLSDEIKNNKTFFITIYRKDGATSFLRVADTQSWKNSIPTVGGRDLTPIQQLNLGFNIEIWKRATQVKFSTKLAYTPKNIDISSHTSESLYNTFGRLMVIKQEQIPLVLMQKAMDNRVLSNERNRALYPFDHIAKKIYEHAPTGKVVR